MTVQTEAIIGARGSDGAYVRNVGVCENACACPPLVVLAIAPGAELRATVRRAHEPPILSPAWWRRLGAWLP